MKAWPAFGIRCSFEPGIRDASSSEFFAGEYFAPRPASERLVNRRLDLLRLNLMRDWRIALAEYIRHYYANYVDAFMSVGGRVSDKSVV